MKTTHTDLSPELKSLLDGAKPLEELDLAELERAVLALERSPRHVAETRKATFVEDVLRALDDQGISKSELARRLGKSRQQLNIMLDEKKKNNFTIETMAKFSTAIGRKLVVRLLGAETEVQLVRNPHVQKSLSSAVLLQKPWQPDPVGVLAPAKEQEGLVTPRNHAGNNEYSLAA